MLLKQSKVNIGLINPKSPDNVSSVMRAAGNFQVDSIFYTGKRYPRALMRNPDIPDMRRKVGQSIPLTEVECLLDIAPVNMKLVCVEFAENAIALPEYEHFMTDSQNLSMAVKITKLFVKVVILIII